jgi:mutator protein MutT
MSKEAGQCVEGVVAVIESDHHLLVIRRAEGVPAAGYWCLPGGAVHEGETPVDAVIREVREEVGLEVEPREQIWQWTQPDGRLQLSWWRTHLISSPEDIRPDHKEVADVQWVTPAELVMLSPLLESNLQFLRFYQNLIK